MKYFSFPLTMCVFLSLASEIRGEDGLAMVWSCDNEAAQRDIEVYYWDGPCHEIRILPEGQDACRVIYKKDGASEVLWRARNDSEYCEPRARALVTKLQGAGFECKLTEASNRCDEALHTPVSGRDKAEPSDLTEVNHIVALDAGPSAELRNLLQKHYDGNYLNAMIAAMPAEFDVQPGADVVSSGSAKKLHVAPPDHFVKTLSDGSYVLVNTLVLDRDATKSFVNFGFEVKNEQYSFLGYAVAEFVADHQVLNADRDKIVVSVMPVAPELCNSTRRTRTIRWGADLSTQNAGAGHDVMGQISIGDCERPEQKSGDP